MAVTPFITDAEATQKIQQSYSQLETQLDAIAGGSQGAISIADTPTEIGYYYPTESGTYTNAGNLVVDLTEGITILIYDGTDWGMQVVPINSTPTGVVEEGNTQAVSGGEVFRKTTSVNDLSDFSLSVNGLVYKYDIEQGTINSSDGENAVNSTRIRTSNLMPVRGYSVSVDEGFELTVLTYTDQGVYIGSSGGNWPSQFQDINFIGKIRIVIRLEGGLGEITPDAPTGLKIQSLQSNLTNIKSRLDAGLNTDFDEILEIEQGSIRAADGENYNSTASLNTRVRTVNFHAASFYKVKVDDSFAVHVFHYDNNYNFIERKTSDWTQGGFTDLFTGFIRVAIVNFPSTDTPIAFTDPINLKIETGAFLYTDFKTEGDEEGGQKEYKPYLTTANFNVTAHRGVYFGNIVPENTVHSLALAKRMGYKAVEIDVKKTMDGHYVVMHDNSINRTMRNADYTAISGTVNVADKTLASLKNDYVFLSETPRFRTEILTIQEYVKFCRDLGMIPMLDIKIPDYEFLDDVHKICGDDFICFSTQKPVLQYARSISKCLCLLNTSSTSGVIEFLDNLGGWCGVSTTNTGVLSEEFISELKEKGYESQASIHSKDNEVDALRKGATMLLSDYSIDVLKNPSEEIYSDDNDFSDFSTTGTITDGIVILENGQVLSKTFSEQILYGGLTADLFFKGSLNISINGSFYASITSEDLDLRHFSLRFRDTTPSIQITASQNSEIHFLNLKISAF